ncbi:putative type VI secretion system effector [Trinickia caryophylli]|uniref:Uncharacterized protein n=1 Tax=Trinickia caryophylli TaxID=28094 RepID=A0A1X7F584_TRICW|nr:putative type VI secretion system effector [Trinickia caryophylli]PMS10428.1 hypothetical protein C0Z17_20280 [Trinickia caryophylli]TRX19453.1 hypothetical protein FNF07_15305 [Trinickia caryophylli]WQE13242.1 putative type VI secretion system effector [Trinickia caryophylli]SMF45510.1 hypothetical protein SAMN06295900_107126 [Trinickia caryophylli]GLU34444.1 hypothetical protein Busp01_42860 [Trinickia caryophylli]
MKKWKSTNSLMLLKGTIAGLERSRRSHDFILTELQRQQVSAAAIAASAMGMGATGVGLIGMAGNSDEEADWVEFELDGKQVTGWLWMMPMRNGDNVEVVAECIDGRYVAYAVKRGTDDLLAVYPHATAGRKVHYRRSVKIWLWISLIIYLVVWLMLLIPGWRSFLGWHGLLFGVLPTFIFWMMMSGFFAFRVSRKFMGFVQIAERIFRAFGWPDVENIDLRRTSREHRRENRLPNFGNLYFRYK